MPPTSSRQPRSMGTASWKLSWMGQSQRCRCLVTIKTLVELLKLFESLRKRMENMLFFLPAKTLTTMVFGNPGHSHFWLSLGPNTQNYLMSLACDLIAFRNKEQLTSQKVLVSWIPMGEKCSFCWFPPWASKIDLLFVVWCPKQCYPKVLKQQNICLLC